jgi:S1-C subfamily serine protease
VPGRHAAPPWASDWRPIPVNAPLRPRAGRTSAWWLAAICLAAAVGVLALGVRWWADAVGQTRPETAGTLSLTGAGSVTSIVDPALVDITATLAYQANTEVEGTGIVLSPSGLVLTNNHVIAGAASIRAVDVGTGQQYTATVLGYDRSHDLALLQLEGAAGLPAARLGNSSEVRLGDPVVGIGNAGGKGGTPTAAAGTVVALDQHIESVNVYDNTSEQLDHIIATDADIEPGDSGGPLADRYGCVIGVDTAGSSGSTSFLMRRGFAIPIDAAMAEVRLIQAGRSSDTVHVGQTAFLGIQVGGGQGRGLAVTGVLYGTPAAQAGLASGDVILALDGQALSSPEALSAVLCRHEPGDAVQMVWDDASGVQHSSIVQFAAGPPA